MNHKILCKKYFFRKEREKGEICSAQNNLKAIPKNLCSRLLFTLLIMLSFSSCNSNSGEPISRISYPSADEVAKRFNNPPPEYSISFYWGWNGDVTEEVIKRDLDNFKSSNVQVVTLEPGYHMPNAYLSEGWFEDVKTAVQLAKERDMKVYLVDEGKYPSGFAGGKIVEEAPELCMKILTVDTTFALGGGEKVSLPLTDNIVSAAAFNQTNGKTQIVELNGHELNWSAPDGDWQLFLVKHIMRSSPTRSVNNPSGGKDRRHALIDYMDPRATGKFMEVTHEKYRYHMGEEFGETILGFRGDEPDYSISGVPYTPGIFGEFKKHKGYDVKPYIATLFSPNPTEEQKRVKADYWEVWSSLFANNFFKIQADWCESHDLDYLVHLNHEENMTGLIRSEGDYFKNMRTVQMPGIDAIWHQIWPGDANPVFPKYASSSAHMNGKLRSFTESFAAYDPRPGFDEAKWILNQQLVRGINMVEVMFVPASSKGESGMRGWLAREDFPAVAKYIQRCCYLLSHGVPAAQLAVLFPTTSIWLGDNETDKIAVEMMQGLLKTQNDFDVIDEYSLDSLLEIQNGSFINKSGQEYAAIIIPPIRAMSAKALSRLKEFEKAGGIVISIGNESVLSIGKTFLDAPEVDISFEVNEPSNRLTNRVIAALPKSDFILEKPCEYIKYTHRKWKGADLYFIFNEGEDSQDLNVTLSGKGKVQVWDAMSGKIKEIPYKEVDGKSVMVNLKIDAWQTAFIVVDKLKK
ncbi:glycosyl hydrolase [Echinicola jeungdonensis]|uniref:Glycosyl hydrolase n=1 Tax=Echinicola jeungdonensis TaxID=709343 RepID=A0ABV5J9V0_9BACT|nr:glycosyl hydrolase [Echinicola jeungdonensis]MDN3669503.1 glycosyl hydrolase [Echinicola jeungdonensis]